MQDEHKTPHMFVSYRRKDLAHDSDVREILARALRLSKSTADLSDNVSKFFVFDDIDLAVGEKWLDKNIRPGAVWFDDIQKKF